MNVKKREIPVKPGGWVRVKRGKYAGDLAQVLEVFDAGELIRIRLIPRLDIYIPEDQKSERKRGKTANRPPQKLFDQKEVNQLARGVKDGHVTRSKGYWVFKSDSYKDGFLEKDVKVASLDLNATKPSLEEVSKFTTGGPDEEGGLASKAAEINALIGSVTVDEYEFEAGDSVVVTTGDLVNLTGTVQGVLHDEVRVVADVQELKVGISSSISTAFLHFHCVGYFNVQNVPIEKVFQIWRLCKSNSGQIQG